MAAVERVERSALSARYYLFRGSRFFKSDNARASVSTLHRFAMRMESAGRMNTRKPFLGLLQRRQLIVPTWRGWLLMFLVVGVAGMIVVRGAYGFLAVNDPLPGDILVIEGWSPDHIIEGAVDEYRKSHYERICLTGGPIEFGNAMREHKTYAEYAKAFCLKLGVPAEVLHTIPALPVERDRSYAEAVAFRQWLRDHDAMDAKINIAGNGPHSRRTRLVYAKALGPKVRIGISNIEERNFDPKRWWASSAGFKNVTGEAIAYFYVWLFFSPPKLEQ